MSGYTGLKKKKKKNLRLLLRCVVPWKENDRKALVEPNNSALVMTMHPRLICIGESLWMSLDHASLICIGLGVPVCQ